MPIVGARPYFWQINDDVQHERLNSTETTELRSVFLSGLVLVASRDCSFLSSICAYSIKFLRRPY